MQAIGSLRGERSAARDWVALAVGSLLLAGVFALALVAGRVPPLSSLFTSPAIFRRFLVVHVDLSLVAWFCAFVAAMGSLAGWGRVSATVAATGTRIALVGLAVLAACAALPSGEPVLSNYLPAIDHPLFVVGLALFGAGLAIGCAAPLVAPIRSDAADVLPPAAASFARAAMLLTIVAITTFAASFATTPGGLAPQAAWELRAWGGGHVLQVASLAAMLAAWITLSARATGRPALSGRAGAIFSALLAMPMLVAPAIALSGTIHAAYKPVFTQLMRWGTWPVTLVVLVACVREIANARAWRDRRVIALLASAIACVTGFVLGAFIRGNSTLVPGHYHAAIGAVTCAFMAVTLEMAPAFGLRAIASRRLAAIQPPLFAAGQLVFAIGFAIAGAAGMGRKVYGAEQAVRTSGQLAGLVVMGVGGLVAVAAGLLFLRLVVPAFRTALANPSRRPVAAAIPVRISATPRRGGA